MGFDLTEILILIIILIFSIVAGIFSAAIYRRTSRGIRYRNLDRARNLYSNKVGKYLDSGNIQTTISELASRANTTEWHAMEEVLLDMMEQANHADKIKVLLLELGYVDYYERRLGKNNIIKRASAIYKLGKMRCERSTWKLIPYLKDGNPEIVTVTIRSLSKIGMPIGLVSILDEIPNILTKPLSSKKTLENSQN
ncbi:MAG: pbs lyase heat-like repeat protein [Actinobacteria bacterium]|nr:pbs lyase heat-like repeat protein [Actinomycetota bacterium]